MTETWNVFTGTDILLGLLGSVGFLSMIVVIVTASGRVDKREKSLKIHKLQNLEPDEHVMEPTEFDIPLDDKEIDDLHNYDTYSK